MDKKIVEELIQTDFTPETVKRELRAITKDHSYRNDMLKNLDILSEKLGGQGASKKAASLMIRYLKA